MNNDLRQAAAHRGWHVVPENSPGFEEGTIAYKVVHDREASLDVRAANDGQPLILVTVSMPAQGC